MNREKDVPEFSAALLGNFKLKTRVLFILFCTVFCFQITFLTVFSINSNYIGTVIPLRMAIFGPIILSSAIIAEFFTLRYLNRISGKEQLRPTLIYTSTFIEVSFPAFLMIFIGSALPTGGLITPVKILNSPFYSIFFIMTILSSLLLNFRLCLFAGITGAIEFFLVNLHYLGQDEQTSGIDYINSIAKSVFIAVVGLLSGIISKNIRASVVASLDAKNELIHKLDTRVAEKTKEVVMQKEEIEKKSHLLQEKQKEIIDSITYARRIQSSLLTSEKYIHKHIERIKKDRT